MNGSPFKQSNTILYCSRWAETVDFYRRMLHLPVSVEKDWFVEFRLTDRSFVSVADAQRTSIAPAAGRGITLTLEVDDVHAMRRRLVGAGADAGEVKRHSWGALRFFCRDPEGHRLEFWQPTDD